MDGLDALSEVEKLKILKNIRIGCASDKEFDSYIEKYRGSMDADEVKRRLEGYFLEDEFALLCHLLNICSSISSLGQSAIGNDGLKIPDYLVTFDTELGEYPCFVEVKTTRNLETSKISNGMLNKYIDYAKKFHKPLYFASRIMLGDNFLWILQSSNEFIKNGKKTKINFLTETSGFALLNDYAISICQPFKLELQFKKEKNESGIYFTDYGYLDDLIITVANTGQNKAVMSTTKDISISYRDILFVNILFDFFTNNQYITPTPNGFTVIKKGELMRSEFISSLVLKVNHVIAPTSSSEINFNASRFLSEIENGKESYIDKRKLLILMDIINSRLEYNGLNPILSFGDLGEPGARRSMLNSLFNKT